MISCCGGAQIPVLQGSIIHGVFAWASYRAFVLDLSHKTRVSSSGHTENPKHRTGQCSLGESRPLDMLRLDFCKRVRECAEIPVEILYCWPYFAHCTVNIFSFLSLEDSVGGATHGKMHENSQYFNLKATLSQRKFCKKGPSAMWGFLLILLLLCFKQQRSVCKNITVKRWDRGTELEEITK